MPASMSASIAGSFLKPASMTKRARATKVAAARAEEGKVINQGVRKEEGKVVDTVVASEVNGKAPYCRCWKSNTFPQCDGSHVAHNKETGDNVGPLIIQSA